MIIITDKAQQKLKEFAEAEGLPTTVRLKVLGGGCAGFQNDMLFDDYIGEMDEVFEIDEIKVIVDSISLQYLEDTTIDYLEGQFQSGFKFINPAATSCGCGNSYSV